MIPFLLFFLIIGVVYSPVLCFDYLFHDDAVLWVKLKEYGFRHYFYYQCISECRYSIAWLLNLENLFVHKLSDLKLLRFLGIVLSSCNAFLLLQQMRRLSFSNIQAFVIISGMFFLPGFADIIFNGSYSCTFTLCILLACWSFQRVEAGKGMAIAVFIFLAAITIYPPAAMFYWVMTGMHILFARDRAGVLFKNKIFRFMTAGLTGLLIYAVLVFFTHYLFSHQIRNSLYNPYAVNHDWPGKWRWFFQEPLVNALNLWNIFPAMTIPAIVSGFIAVTVLITIIRKGITLTDLRQACLFVFLVFLTFLPNLAAHGNAAFYRCLLPLTSLIWLVLVWAILKWNKIFILSIIVAVAGITTFHNVLYHRVLPSFIEYNAYKTMAQEVHSKKIDAIHIVLPYHYPSRERYDEFGVLSSHYLFDIYHLIYCAFKETGAPSRPFPLVYVSFPGDSTLYELEEIYFQKMPDGRWFFKVLNRDDRFHEYDHSGRHTLDRGLTNLLSPQKIFPKRLNWYILNISDIYRP